jgi:hypothetical protein
MSERVCESCGQFDDELTLVRRIYLLGPDEPTPADGPAELWCVSCTSQYPNQPAND